MRLSLIPTPRRWTGGKDHYYWLTAFLAARGLQVRTCRLIALTTFALGLTPIILVLGGTDPRRTWWIALVVTVCCIVNAAVWARPHWPSRTASQATSLLSTGCIAAFCLLQPNPLVGVLGSMAFLCQTVFISFFHSARLLAMCWTVAAVTLLILAVRLGRSDPSLALSSLIIVGFVNVFAAVACAMAVRLIDHQIRHGDIEPLTGLLTRESFDEKVAELIGARSRNDDRFLVVTVITLDGYSLLASLQGAVGTSRARITVGQQLRETARSDALIAHVGDAEFLIADLFTTIDPRPMVERVRGAIGAPPSQLKASVGVVSTPLHPLAQHSAPEVLDELLTIASTAMYDARKAGGNQARYVLDPHLAVLEDHDGDWPSLA